MCVCIPRKRPRKKIYTQIHTYRYINIRKLLFFVVYSYSISFNHSLFCYCSSISHKHTVRGYKRITDVLQLLCVFVIVSLFILCCFISCVCVCFFSLICAFLSISCIQVTNIKMRRLRLALFVSSQPFHHFQRIQRCC